MEIQRFVNEGADEVVEADVWIEDARISLGQVMSNCKEMWHDKTIEDWCKTVRADAHSVILALDELQKSISSRVVYGDE